MNKEEQTISTEQYQCKSYYDDNNILRDCSCGKCEDKEQHKMNKEEKDKKEMNEQFMLDAFLHANLEVDLRLGLKGIIKRKGNKLIMEVWTAYLGGDISIAKQEDRVEWKQADELSIKII